MASSKSLALDRVGSKQLQVVHRYLEGVALPWVDVVPLCFSEWARNGDTISGFAVGGLAIISLEREFWFCCALASARPAH